MIILPWNQANLLSIASSLLEGRVVVLPTDTLYGTLAVAQNRRAVGETYDLKGRMPNKPCIILISSIKDLQIFDIKLNSWQKDHIKKFWPGPVSVILPCLQSKLEYLHRGTNSLAFRLPKDSKLKELLSITGPLIAPSANPEGLPPAKNIPQAKAYFLDKINLYIDGGELNNNPSTLVSLLNNKLEVLRGVLKK